jgi:hypothetical protein
MLTVGTRGKAGERTSLGIGTGGELIPDSLAAVRRRFLSSRIASKDGAGDEDRVPGALTEPGTEVAIPALETYLFFRVKLGAERESSGDVDAL